MTRNVLKVFLIVAAAFALAACRTAPVHNVEEAAIVSGTGENLTTEQVKNAIVRAGASLGWDMKEVEKGHLVGTLFLRSHMAQVDITYDADAYSIHYKDSSNLNYDGTNIHSNYNGWIENLQRNIQSQLTTI